MARHRVRPDAGYCNPANLPRGPNGRPLCRFCQAEVPRGRRTFCGDACVDRWKVQTDPRHVRAKLWERDRGVCRRCRLDTDLLRLQLDGLRRQGKPGIGDRRPISEVVAAGRRYREILARYRVDGLTSLWQADHIVPVEFGGGLCGLDGFQSLCIFCHREKTADQARMAAAARAAARESPGTPPASPPSLLKDSLG